MPHYRLMPLLVACVACLSLSACGSDDETAATTSPRADTPTETAPPPPGDTTANATPSGPASRSRGDDGPGAQAGAPTSGDENPGTDGSDRPSDRTPNGSAKDGSSSASASGSSKRSSKSSGGGSKDKAPAAPQVPKVLQDYAKGGEPASKDEAASVRDSMLGFQDALVAQDAAKACSYTLGLPAKSDPGTPSPSCETLIEGSKMAPPTDRDREMIRSAKITVNGDRASIEMGEAGVPMPFRNVDGRWRIDYGTLLGIGDSAG